MLTDFVEVRDRLQEDPIVWLAQHEEEDRLLAKLDSLLPEGWTIGSFMKLGTRSQWAIVYVLDDVTSGYYEQHTSFNRSDDRLELLEMEIAKETRRIEREEARAGEKDV